MPSSSVLPTTKVWLMSSSVLTMLCQKPNVNLSFVTIEYICRPFVAAFSAHRYRLEKFLSGLDLIEFETKLY